ncbi:polysaccharide biosynthesis/export family protein [Pikeienuella sp. HZG-20]|uniref:polysaccharide biosynthesis/export family protein n=1 Tax=Paludibacillus litoralis TaxID=3133267 RepID=UPI0030EE776D
MFRTSYALRRLLLSLSILLATHLPAAAEGEVRLAPGDTVAFSVLGAPNLDRRAMIGVDGAIYLPLAGKVVASGLTLDELREAVYAALRDRAYRVSGSDGEDVWRRPQEDEIYLDISEYRPVYVTGDVRNPGEVTYRPGMSVRQALANAGGVGRPLEETSEDEILKLLTERSLLLGRIETQIINLERLKADLDALLSMRNADDPAGEGTADATIDSDASPELKELARRWLVARENLRELTDKGNELVLDQMENRLDVLKELEAASKQSLSFEEEALARVMKLAERGVVPASSVAEARGGLLQSSTRALETSGEVLRMRLELTRFAEEAKADVTREEVRLLDEVSNGTAQLRDLQRQLNALNSWLAFRGATPAVEQAAAVRMTLFRSHLTDMAEGEEATPAMIMAPGDVLEVTLPPPDSAPATR